jgi:hypothetical protein
MALALLLQAGKQKKEIAVTMAAIGPRAKNLSTSGDCLLVEIHRKNSSQKYRSCRTYTA